MDPTTTKKDIEKNNQSSMELVGCRSSVSDFRYFQGTTDCTGKGSEVMSVELPLACVAGGFVGDAWLNSLAPKPEK